MQRSWLVISIILQCLHKSNRTMLTFEAAHSTVVRKVLPSNFYGCHIRCYSFSNSLFIYKRETSKLPFKININSESGNVITRKLPLWSHADYCRRSSVYSCTAHGIQSIWLMLRALTGLLCIVELLSRTMCSLFVLISVYFAA